MYQEYVDTLKCNSIFRNIVIPLLLVLITIIFNGIAIYITPPIAGPVNGINMGFAIGMFLSILFIILSAKVISKITVFELGFVKEKILLFYGFGALLGLATVSVVFLIIFCIGSVNVSYVFNPLFISNILFALLFFVFQGMFEELLVRGYLMLNFSKIMGNKWAIVLSSLIFSLLHALNPNVKFMPLVNIFIFGLVFGYLYYSTGNMWIVSAAHSFWNFCLGFIYGSNISGIFVEGTVLKTTPNGNELINGGEFGFEGSIITTLLGMLCILILFKYNLMKEQNIVE